MAVRVNGQMIMTNNHRRDGKDERRDEEQSDDRLHGAGINR